MKYKARISWQANLRGYDDFEVEASSEEEAKDLAKDELMERSIDYNDYVKIIDNDYDIDLIEPVFADNTEEMDRSFKKLCQVECDHNYETVVMCRDCGRVILEQSDES